MFCFLSIYSSNSLLHRENSRQWAFIKVCLIKCIFKSFRIVICKVRQHQSYLQIHKFTTPKRSRKEERAGGHITHPYNCKNSPRNLWLLHFPENHDLNEIEFTLPDDTSKEVLSFQEYRFWIRIFWKMTSLKNKNLAKRVWSFLVIKFYILE